MRFFCFIRRTQIRVLRHPNVSPSPVLQCTCGPSQAYETIYEMYSDFIDCDANNESTNNVLVNVQYYEMLSSLITSCR